MAGANLHARLLLRAMRDAGLPPGLVVDEQGTARANKLSRWLENDILGVPPIGELLGADTRYEVVDAFDGARSLALLSDFAPSYLVSGGAGIFRCPLLRLPRLGVLNIHPGLLPEYRGVDPVLWALADGGELGATVHLMSEGIDEGAILLRSPLAAPPLARSVLGWRLACMAHGAEMLTRFLSDPTSFPPVVQDETCARYMKAFPAERMADVEAAARARAFP
ncbi:MAG: formyltransferase family protein [Alphaproteobacteria bacterium]